LKILHDLIESDNGGRWPIIGIDLSQQPIKDFKKPIKIEVTTPHEDHFIHALEDIQEGIQNNKTSIRHPTIIPTRVPI
jgi:hypothetical protein